MKPILLITLLIFTVQLSFSQEHWLINADASPDCKMIKSGKFVNKESEKITTPGYFIIFEKEFATEYINNGEYYLKSKIEFLSNCKYKSTVIEVTIPDYKLGVGTIIYTEILETSQSDKLVKIKSTFQDSDHFFVLEKVE